jgi:outer membrane cobalamin receptor
MRDDMSDVRTCCSLVGALIVALAGARSAVAAEGLTDGATAAGASYRSTVRPGPAVAPLTRSTSTVTTLDKAAIDALPLGEDRPIDQAIATAPGLVQDGLGTVIPRGRFVASVQYRLDGVPVPESVGNLLLQSIPLRLVESLELYTGGMPAELGNRLGAVVDITTRAARATPDGAVQLRYGSYDTVEPSATYARRLGCVGVSVGGSFFSSQRALDPPAITPLVHDAGYRGNAFLRLDLTPRPRDRLELIALYIYNRYQIPIDPTVRPGDPSQPALGRLPDAYGNEPPPFVPRDTDATEREQEAFVAVSWFHSFGERGDLQLSPYYKLSRGQLDGDPAHALGATADPGATATSVGRLGQHAGAVAHYTLARGAHALKAGLELDGLVGQIAYNAWHRLDPGGGIDPTKTMSGYDTLGALRYDGYVQHRWEHGRFTLTSGLRFDAYHLVLPGGASDDEGGVSPRLGLSFFLARRLAARVAVGMTWQPPPLLDAASAARLHGDGDGVSFDLKPETGAYGELGVDVMAARWIRFGVTGWGRLAWNQLDDNVLGDSGLVGYYNYARGRALGVDGTLQVVVGPLTSFANVEWEIAQGQEIISSKYLFDAAELVSNAWETLDESQAWTANLGATVRAGAGMATLLANYGSGLRTGDMNTQHVPGHLRVDLTLAWSFDEFPLRPRLAVDIVNLFDARYAYRLANGLFGSTWAPPRELFVRVAVPLALPAHTR